MAELSYATLGHFILLIYMDSHDLLHRFHDFIVYELLRDSLLPGAFSKYSVQK